MRSSIWLRGIQENLDFLRGCCVVGFGAASAGVVVGFDAGLGLGVDCF